MNNTRKLVEGAMMLAMLGALLLINRQSANFLETFFSFIIPLPLIVYRLRYDQKYFLILSVSAVFLSIILGSLTTIFYVLNAIIISGVYAYMVKKGKSNFMILCGTIMITLCSNIITGILFASFFGYDIMESLKMMENLLQQMQLNQYFDQAYLDKLLLSMIVYSTLFAGVLEGIVIHLLSYLTLKKLKMTHLGLTIKPVFQWSIPKSVTHLCLLAYFVGNFAINLVNNANISVAIVLIGTTGGITLAFFGYIASLYVCMVKFKKNYSILIIIMIVLFFPLAYPLLVCSGYLYLVSDLKNKLLRR